jgi:hypothetical protein
MANKLAFVTESVSEREEKVEEFEIYSVELAQASLEQPPRQLTHDEAVEQDLHWGKDSKHIFFEVQYGSVEGKYKDTQTRLYWIDADSGEIQRWAADFTGANWGTTIPVLTMSIFLEDFPGMCRSAIRKKPPSIK